MSDHESFRAAICAAPDDDLPRKVYADYLDEIGDPLGRFIRVQLAVEELEDATEGEVHRTGMCSPYCKACPERDRLIQESQVLLRENAATWLQPNPTPFNPVTDYPHVGWGIQTFHYGMGYISVYFKRGFVSGISCELDDWIGGNTRTSIGYCDRIIRHHPVRYVQITDKEPHNSFSGHYHRLEWYRTNSREVYRNHPRSDLPEEMFDALVEVGKGCQSYYDIYRYYYGPGYDLKTEGEADLQACEDLSEACLLVARRRLAEYVRAIEIRKTVSKSRNTSRRKS